MSPLTPARQITRASLVAGGVFLVALLGVTLLTLDGVGARGSAAVTRQAAPSRPPPARKTVLRNEVVTISATGDITFGSTPVLPPDEARSLFAGVEHELRAWLVLGNLETALADTGSSKCAPRSTSCFSFRAPPSYARRLKAAGFTMLNLANNHAFDFGAAGQAETVAALDAARLRHTGRPGEIAHQRVGAVRLAVVGFAPYRWAQDLLDLDAARRIVRRAGRTADVVVVTMHAGAEGSAATHVPQGPEVYLGEQRGNSRAFAHAVVDAGADLVVGDGPHVLRGLEWYRGRLVAYSLGNFSAYKNFALSGLSAVSGILQVSLRGNGGWRSGRLVPVQLVGDGTPRLDPRGAALDAVRSLSRVDFGSHAVRVGRIGALSPPPAG